MARFVLVAGAFHGAWCWELVIPLLEVRRHRAEAVELPGTGSDRTPLPGPDMNVWVRTVAEAIGSDPEPVILVGHSRGGMVISQVAELIPDRIRLNVYLTASLMLDGECATDILKILPEGSFERPTLTPTTDGLAIACDPDEERRLIYQRTRPALVERAIAHIRPEPAFGLTQPLSLSAERYGRVPRAYIECLEDLWIPLAAQRAMTARQPCAHIRSIDTDHSPCYSQPEQVAELLNDLAKAAE